MDATICAFFISQDKLSHSMMISVHVLCYQPSCHHCSLLANIFKFASALETGVNSCNEFCWYNHHHWTFFSNKIIRHVSKFPDRLLCIIYVYSFRDQVLQLHIEKLQHRLFRSVLKIAKNLLVTSYIRPPAWNNSAPTGWIFLKFYIWVFF